MSLPRITFSTPTANDKGGVIPNSAIDYSRYKLNPVILRNHNWEDYAIGYMTKINPNDCSAEPVFHNITDDSKICSKMYEEGYLRTASIGGVAYWKADQFGNVLTDKDGNKQCERFLLYEISLPTLPSNPTAVTNESINLGAKIYEESELEFLDGEILKLNTNIQTINLMAKSEKNSQEPKEVTNEVIEQITGTAEQVVEPEKVVTKKEPAIKTAKTVILGSDKGTGIPFIDRIIGAAKELADSFMTPVPEHKEPDGDEPVQTSQQPISTEQPTPIGLAVEPDGDEPKISKEKPEDNVQPEPIGLEVVKECNPTKMEAGEEEDYEKSEKNNNLKKEEKMSAEPQKLSQEEAAEKLTLAVKPEHTQAVKIHAGVPFTKLASDKGEGERLLNRVLAVDSNKSISDYAVVLNSILDDSKFNAIVEKTRLMTNISDSAVHAMTQNPNARVGQNLKEVASRLSSGQIEKMNYRTGTMEKTLLTSSDDALTTPDVIAVEWLSLAIFKLFPKGSWKNDIPVLPAQMTGSNLGVIWTNVGVAPTYTKGSAPANATDTTYSDTAVSVKLTPYYIPSIRWTPLNMHMMRTDMMGTGWAQALAGWNAYIDDDLLYKLAALVPAASIINTSGSSFSIAASTDPDSFYFSPSFTGSLAKPQLNDIITMEQLFNKQNFSLEGERTTLVIDPTMDSYLAKDPATQSKLTRWVNENGADLTKFKNTILQERSRVAVYDQATGLVKDPDGVITATSVSAGIGFIPSQIAIALGMLDVFMIQDPANYGYKMSADTRMGIKPLRANYNGLALYTYGTPSI